MSGPAPGSAEASLTRERWEARGREQGFAFALDQGVSLEAIEREIGATQQMLGGSEPLRLAGGSAVITRAYLLALEQSAALLRNLPFWRSRMLSPLDLVPSAIGLRWGMTQAECAAAIPDFVKHEGGRWVSAAIWVASAAVPVRLGFSAANGLERIEHVLRESMEFWDTYQEGEMHAIGTEFRRQYRDLVEACTARLGTPLYSGSWGSPGYPEEQTAAQITFWGCAEARLQVEYDHPDKELPFSVGLVTYPRPA